MPNFIPSFAHRLLSRLHAVGAAPMGSPDPAVIDALGVSAPVLTLIGPSMAAFSPDQAHELGYALGRR